MRVRSDGTWFYNGSPIGRAALVRLFASILRKDEERYVLVTPVEKVGITVEDVPFIATAMRLEGEGARQALIFETNVGDATRAGPEHKMRFELGAHDGVKPYVHVRGGLWARLTRALTHDLIDIAAERRIRLEGQAQEEDFLGIASAGAFFPICRTSEMAGVGT
jgi:hypothetical protein